MGLRSFLIHSSDAITFEILASFRLSAFMDRYTMPTLIFKSGNDEFFMLDDFQFFIKDFPETAVTHSLYVKA